MQRARVLRGVVRAAIPIAFALVGAGCQSAGTNAPAGAGTVAAEPPTGSGSGAESEMGGTVNSTAKVSEMDTSMDGGVEEILPSTRRSAAGLPEPVPNYLSWFQLGRAPGGNGTPAAEAHHPACRAYILFPDQNKHSQGEEIPANLPEETLIVLEEKRPGGNFIARVRTMTRVPEGWKFSSYSRSSNATPFSEEAQTSRCATCHAPPPAATGARGTESGAPGAGDTGSAAGAKATARAASGIQSRLILE